MDKTQVFKCVKNIHRIVSQLPIEQPLKAMIYKELTKLKEAVHK